LVRRALEVHMPRDVRQAYQLIEQQEQAVIRMALSDLSD
jgi:hypothetical protein